MCHIIYHESIYDIYIYFQVKSTLKIYQNENRRKELKKIIFILMLAWMPLSAAPLMHPYNLDFEEGTPGSMPRGWLIPEYAVSKSYGAMITETEVKSGKYCLELSRFAEFKDSVYGSVMQSVEAKPYRGKIVKFGAWVRAEISGPVGSAHLWLIEYLPGDNIRFYDLMENQPIVTNTWEYYEITADISEEADYINFGLMLKGNGKAWIDGAKFDITNDDNTGLTPPKKLSSRENANLSAFAKLYGYARYFSPARESLSLDWDKFAIYGIRQIENAADDKELRKILNDIFLPINPAIKIFDPKLPPEDYYYPSKPANAINDAAIAWLHLGSPAVPESKLMSSKPVNVYQSLRASEGAAVQLIDVSAYGGKKINFRIKAKADLIAPNGRAEIRLFPETADKKTDVAELIKIANIKVNKWKEYSLETTLPKNAMGLRLGLILTGDGTVNFDNASLTIIDNGKEIMAALRNPNFDEDMPGKLTRGWRFLPSSETSGYKAEIVTTDKKGGKELQISSDINSVIKLPMPGEMFMTNLNEKIRIALPVCLYTDYDGTLPHSGNAEELYKNINEFKFRNGRDRYTRLAVLIEAWNIFKLFNLYSHDNAAWDELLAKLIEKASSDRNDRDFLLTLQMLASKLNDSQSRVWLSGENFYYGLPFLMKWKGDKLVVTQVHSSCTDVKPGYIISSINGTDAKKYLDSLGQYISSANQPRKYLRAIAGLRTGVENSPVRMELINNEVKTTSHEFRRNVFLNDLNEERLPAASMIRDGIYYIDLTRINDHGFFELIDTLSKAKGIILDLRGSTSVSEHVLGFFIKEPIKSEAWKIPVFLRPDKPAEFYKSIEINIKARGKLADASVVFLQDERTIGFSEELISLVRDYKIGKIIGSPGAGTAGELSSFSLGDNYGFSMTAIKGVDRNGNDIYGTGIKPTFDMNSVIEKDETLQLAFELLY